MKKYFVLATLIGFFLLFPLVSKAYEAVYDYTIFIRRGISSSMLKIGQDCEGGELILLKKPAYFTDDRFFKTNAHLCNGRYKDFTGYFYYDASSTYYMNERETDFFVAQGKNGDNVFVIVGAFSETESFWRASNFIYIVYVGLGVGILGVSVFLFWKKFLFKNKLPVK
jgi:hypothetical protein